VNPHNLFVNMLVKCTCCCFKNDRGYAQQLVYLNEELKAKLMMCAEGAEKFRLIPAASKKLPLTVSKKLPSRAYIYNIQTQTAPTHTFMINELHFSHNKKC
jgi:hypothetical protein